ncbi:MAG: hypothetical protein IKQ33_02705 [Clostridia bacterium]|nr:hypothetical protein [Clostridia bacterium]
MDINNLQRRIATIESKLDMIKVKHFNDQNYNYKFSNGKNEAFVSLISQESDLNSINVEDPNRLFLVLSENVKIRSGNCISENDIDTLIKMKETTKKEVFDKIVDYVFFEKNNDNLFSIINMMNENESEYEVETDNKPMQSDKKADVSSHIIEILNKEFENCGGFTINKKYYISKDNTTAVFAMRSKRYDSVSYKYWYTFHNYQKDYLDNYKKSYILLYFDDIDECVIINTNKMYEYLNKLNTSKYGGSGTIGWHIYVQEENGTYMLRIPKEGLIKIQASEKEETAKDVASADTLKLSLNDYRIVKGKMK